MLSTAVLFFAQVHATALDEALRIAHAQQAASKQDEFAETNGADQFAGQDFVVRRRFHSGDERDAPSGPFYTYHDGELRLIFSSQKLSAAGSGGAHYPTADIGGRKLPRKGYVGANAFGASASVNVFDLLQDEVSFVTGPKAELNPYFDPADVAYYKRRAMELPEDTYWVSLPQPGPSAKALALDAEVLLEGKLVAFPEGKLARCTSRFAGATIDSPTEVRRSVCQIGAQIARVAFIRRSTGEVIKEWVAP